MCLYVPGGRDIETCKADLVVYKILTINNLSPWYDFAYRPNVLVRHRKALVFDVCCRRVIYEGFHAFLTKAQANFLAVRFVDAAGAGRSYKVVKMVIPKGAKMVRGAGDEVVSTSLRTGSLQALPVRAESLVGLR